MVLMDLTYLVCHREIADYRINDDRFQITPISLE
jgi:hypothetical protein